MGRSAPTDTKATRADRLAETLRQNLHRRKAQQRLRQSAPPEAPAGPSRDQPDTPDTPPHSET